MRKWLELVVFKFNQLERQLKNIKNLILKKYKESITK